MVGRFEDLKSKKLLKLRFVPWGTLQFSTLVLNFSWARTWERNNNNSPSVMIFIFPVIGFCRNLVWCWRTINVGKWHGRISQEKSSSLIIHENRFWAYFGHFLEIDCFGCFDVAYSDRYYWALFSLKKRAKSV